MKTRIHALAGAIAFLTIASFWIATLVAELFLSDAAIYMVKRAILYGLALLLPAMMIAGATGASLARSCALPLARTKQVRMRVLAGNGLLVMLPAAVFLYLKATRGEFDTGFYTVQIVELTVGLLQLALLSKNARDGFRLAGLHAGARASRAGIES